MVVLVCTPQPAYPQLTSGATVNSGADTALAMSSLPPVLRFGMDKLANTFLFRGELTGTFAVPLGMLLVRSQYRGSTIRTSTPASRDDGDIFLRYEAPFTQDWSFILVHNALISADTRSIGLNRLQQINLSAGVQYRPLENIKLLATTGGEYNEQLGIADRGWNIAAGGTVQNQRFDEYRIGADANASFSQLTNNRQNRQTNIRLSVARSFEGDAQLEISGQYSTLQREFYTFIQQTSLGAPAVQTAVETRAETLWRSNVRLLVPIVRGVDFDVQGALESWQIGRWYRAPVQQVSFTAIDRSVDQLRISGTAMLRATFEGSSHALGLTLESRDETNSVNNRFALPDADVQALRITEKQRDNISLRRVLSAQSSWMLSPQDSLRWDASFALLQYDTPSVLNFDDRDELAITAAGAYTRILSPMLSATLFLEARFLHLVFLKAQRSAQNNWNRIFRLAPSVQLNTGVFSMRPQFEVLANYTSFDFEELLGAAQSFSFRQVAYRDSLVWNMTQNSTIESRVIFRYFERGEFQWRAFAETPRDVNYEAFVRTLLFLTPVVQWQNPFGGNGRVMRVGLGVRYYALSQRASEFTAARIPEFLNQILAPETLIEMPFVSGTTVRLNGWYEFQFDRGTLARRVPNFTLSAFVPL